MNTPLSRRTALQAAGATVLAAGLSGGLTATAAHAAMKAMTAAVATATRTRCIRRARDMEPESPPCLRRA